MLRYIFQGLPFLIFLNFDLTFDRAMMPLYLVVSCVTACEILASALVCRRACAFSLTLSSED